MQLPTIRVTAGVIRKGDTVLIARRSAHDSHGGKWEFPGGTVEAGESPEDCIVREMREELGISVRIVRYLGASEDHSLRRRLELFFYELEHLDGEIRIVEHDAFLWTAIRELPNFTFPPADLPIIRHWAALGEVTPLP
jgi:8-oxo-dGTP diphosphatase